MTILRGDYCLSGRAWRRLEDTTHGLTRLEQLVVHEICRVTEQDERHSNVVDGNVVPPLDLTETKRIEARLGTKTIASHLLLTLARGDAFEPPNTIIDCMVYLDQVQAHAATPEAGLRRFVRGW